MKVYVEKFRKADDDFSYKEVNVTPQDLGEHYGDHPVYQYALNAEDAIHFGLSGEFFDFDNYNFAIGGYREFPEETFFWNGETLFPPPMFLPDIFNSNPVPPKN